MRNYCCFVTDSSTGSTQDARAGSPHPPQSLASPRVARSPGARAAPLKCDCAPEHTLRNCDYARLRARTGAETRRRWLTGRFDVLTTWLFLRPEAAVRPEPARRTAIGRAARPHRPAETCHTERLGWPGTCRCGACEAALRA